LIVVTAPCDAGRRPFNERSAAGCGR